MIAAYRFRAGVMAGLCTLAVGCVAPGTGDAAQALAAPVPTAAHTGRAERLADALLMADRAERAQDATTLALAAQRLEQLKPKPQTEQDAATMRRWMARLPTNGGPMRGRALGPAYRSAALNPGATAQLNQTFLGGRSAQIVLKVSRGPAPQLVVRDQSDRQVCKTSDDPITCLWVPLYTQRHSIEIVNTGPAMSEFYIVFD